MWDEKLNLWDLMLSLRKRIRIELNCQSVPENALVGKNPHTSGFRSAVSVEEKHTEV